MWNKRSEGEVGFSRGWDSSWIDERKLKPKESYNKPQEVTRNYKLLRVTWIIDPSKNHLTIYKELPFELLINPKN